MTNREMMGYKISIAEMHLQKAKSMFEMIELDNAKIQSDFTSLLNYCRDLKLNLKKQGKYEHNA